MIIIASQLPESVLCTLPNGEHIEVTMLVAERDDVFAEPNAEAAVALLSSYFDCQGS